MVAIVAEPIDEGLHVGSQTPRPRHVPVRKNGLAGDCVAHRVKGSAGLIERRHGRIMRSLALYELGDTSYGDLEDPVFRGQLQKLPTDWIEVIPLTVAAVQKIVKHNLSRVELELGGVMKSPERYSTGRHEGYRLEFSNGEYAFFENGSDVFSLSWSSALPLTEAMDRMFALVSAKHPPHKGVLSVDGGWVKGSVRELRERIDQDFPEINFARFNGDDLALAWRSDAGRSDVGNLRLHECFIIASGADQALLRNLLAVSGTPAVGAAADDILRVVETDLAHYPQT